MQATLIFKLLQLEDEVCLHGCNTVQTGDSRRKGNKKGEVAPWILVDRII